MPRNVVIFERLIYTSIVVGLFALLADFGRLFKIASPLSIAAVNLLSIAVLALLAWLVARRTSNLARWLLVAFSLVELPFVIAVLFVTEAGGANIDKPSIFTVALVALQVAAQAAALVFTFTGDARTWFVRFSRPVWLSDIEMPGSVARFEMAAYAGVALSLVVAPLEFLRATEELHGGSATVVGLKAGLALLEAFKIAAAWALIWLTARRRRNWARWLFLAYFIAVLTALGFTFGRSGWLLLGLGAAQRLVWAVALYFVFAADSHSWFKRVSDQPAAYSGHSKPRVRIPAGRRVVAEPGQFDHHGLVAAHVAEVGDLGVGRYTAAPPVFRLLWAMGLRVPPPLFLGILPLTLITGGVFATFWGFGMWLFAWRTQRGLPIWLALAMSVLAGAVFGSAMATYYRWRSDKLPLTSWANFLPPV